jgi:hypothetical protein
MYKTIHRIEHAPNGKREVLEPNSVIDSIDNAEALLAAGAIVHFEPTEVTITAKEKPKAKKAKADGDAPASEDFG